MGPRLPLALLLVLALGACAAQPTPYQPRSAGGGYAQQQLDDHTWRVTFEGNFDTPRETVEDYLLYRAAEIMRFGGFDRFVMVEKEIETRVEYVDDGYYAYPYPYWHPRFRTRYPEPYYYGPRRSISFVRYTGYATIRTYSGGAPPAGLTVYDANEVIRRLGPTIRLPGQAG